ncbi:circularly permuted type 2 ATP-grasp protein [Fulvimarina manganoxydans]|nr:circularly permuted type 2 ATP-grasp protein [Fulvimarina manganoxydans]MEE2951146.1 circularly permuted type 2 ATP-grasp protein [Pseudomonadota bacterium]
MTAGGRDEMIGPGGVIKPHYRSVVEQLFGLSPAERVQRLQRARQYLSEAGVFHRVYAPTELSEETREWPLSHPALVIDPLEWSELSDGLVQRAEFLEKLAADIYGERRLVRDGILPSALVAQNPEFVHPLADQARPGEPLIRFIAVDLGRGPDGRWWVLGDRTQAPSGAGFVLENRVANQKAFPDIIRKMNVERLAPFFQRFREMLYELAGPDRTRLGLLSPGPHNETYFEHAYLARYLGLLLLEGGDLVVHGDEATVRTVSGFNPIHVLWRRLDSDFVDPLELFEGSRIGTPGLLRAVRAGKLTVVNAIGSGILETPAFLAFQRPMARALLGRDLDLPTVATWWCGQASERAYVEAHRERLQLAPAFPAAHGRSGRVPLPEGSETLLKHESRAVDLKTDGVRWVGREIAALSTAPVLVDESLAPRPVILRAFLCRDSEGWHVMPGGFARVADQRDARVISMQQGGGSIDVWIPSKGQEIRPVTLLSNRTTRFERRIPGALPARAADNLYWLGRYAERCEAAARLLRVYGARVDESSSAGAIEETLLALVRLFGVDADPANPGRGLLSLARQASETASRIRDRFSPDAWRALNEIVGLIMEAKAEDGEVELVGLTSSILTHLSGFAGLVHENMYQFTGWRFMQMGRCLERGFITATVTSRLIPDDDLRDGALEALLEFTDSRVTYRRRYSVDLSRETVLDLAVLDPLNPRSIAFQINTIRATLADLPDQNEAETLDTLTRRVSRLQVRLQTADAEEANQAFITRIAADLSDISNLLTARYLLSAPDGVKEGPAPE